MRHRSWRSSAAATSPRDQRSRVAMRDARCAMCGNTKYEGKTFEMERMQSTWENLVDYDTSERRATLTLRELTQMGFDFESFLDVPLGYSQSNGPSSRDASRRAPQRDRGSCRVTSAPPSQLLVALAEVRQGRRYSSPTTCSCGAWRGASAPGADVRLEPGVVGAGPGRVERAVTETRCSSFEPEQPDRLRAFGRLDAAHRRSLRATGRGCSPTRCISAPRWRPARARRASGA